MYADPAVYWFNAVWGSGPDDVYAVGSQGAIAHYDGDTWAPMTSGTGVYLYGVGGNGPDDVYAVGDLGTILHYDGVAWSAVASPTFTALTTAWGNGEGRQILVGGASGALFLGDGGNWVKLDASPLVYVDDIWSSGGHVFIGGSSTRSLELVRTTIACGGAEVVCDDYWDDDCDGAADACDPDCAGRGPAEQCADQRDDDCDGATDCADPDCAGFTGC